MHVTPSLLLLSLSLAFSSLSISSSRLYNHLLFSCITFPSPIPCFSFFLLNSSLLSTCIALFSFSPMLHFFPSISFSLIFSPLHFSLFSLLSLILLSPFPSRHSSFPLLSFPLPCLSMWCRNVELHLITHCHSILFSLWKRTCIRHFVYLRVLKSVCIASRRKVSTQSRVFGILFRASGLVWGRGSLGMSPLPLRWSISSS